MPIDAIKTPKQTLLESGTEFKGTLKSTCAVVVNGTIDGEIDAPEITVTRSGAVLGTIKAKKLRSQGTLSGNVDAGEVFLSGVVRSQTVIKARSLEVKLGSSEKGHLELTFGECNLELGQAPPEHDGAGSAAAGMELTTTSSEPDASDGWAPLESSDSPAVSPPPLGRSTWKSSRMS
jgi:cytoskeletal protein CcmA (bactofilin family)